MPFLQQFDDGLVLLVGALHPGSLATSPVDQEATAVFGKRIDPVALAAALEAGDGRPTIVALQAGNVHSGAFDPFTEAIVAAHDAGAWVHVDGAFGLFAAASPTRRHLVAGMDAADSWATDAHKWLNVPYDCGFAFVRDPALLAKVFSLAAAYLPEEEPEPTYGYLTPESSQRARALTVWATLRAWVCNA